MLLLVPLATPAAAQPPGQSFVNDPTTNNSDCSFNLSWTPAAGATQYLISAAINGVPIGVFNLGGFLAVRTPPLVPSNYTFQIITVNNFGQTPGPARTFTLGCATAPPPSGVPGLPVITSAVASGNTVTITWVNGTNAAGTQLEAVFQSSATPQVFNIDLPAGVSSFTVPGVPAGNFLVRLRNRNAFGLGPQTEYRLIVVGTVLTSGDLQVTLTWNTTADIDLHVIEPSGRKVFYAARTGITAFLDVDDTNGFGPENIFVRAGQAAPGIYQVYIVHFSGAPNTSETISVSLLPGSPNSRVALFTRTTPSGNTSLGYNVANVDIFNRTIVETTGTRVVDEPLDARPKVQQ
jgi:hypothetical protein